MPKRDDRVFTLPIRVIVVEEGEERILDYDGERPLSFGRAEECTIPLLTSRASRYHAEIIGEGGRFTLVDPGSSNGTFVGGEKISHHALRPGDKIEIGDACIIFGEIPPPPAPSARPPAPRTKGERAVAQAARAERLPAPEPPRSSPFAIVDALLGVLLVLLLGLLLREFVGGRSTDRRQAASGSAGNGLAVTGSESPGGLVGGDPSPASMPPSLLPGTTGAIVTSSSPTLIERDALDSLFIVERRIVRGESRFDALEDLEELVRSYPGTPAADRGRHLALVLDGLRASERENRRREADRALAPLVGSERYGDALVVLRFLSALDGPEEDRISWRNRAIEVERIAAERLRGLEDELSGLLRAGLGAEALRALVAVRDRFGGISAYEEALPRYLDVGLGEVGSVARGTAAPPELVELDAQATRAFTECRFTDLVPILHRILGLDLPGDERMKHLEELVEAHYLQAMWISFIEGAGGGGVQIEVSRDYTGRLVRASQQEIELERTIAGGTFTDIRPWSQVTPVQRYALFSAVKHERDGLLGLVFLARRGGDPEGFDRALLRLHRQGTGRELAEAVLARHRGEPVPEKGYIEHRGRLMTPAEKTAELARARELREQEREAMAQMKRLEKAEKVTEVIDWVLLLRAQGSFTLADRVLREIVAKTDPTMGAEAMRLLEDPVLASVPIRESGDPEHRIDFFILGDGYLPEDEHQEAFLNAARACEKILLSVDPYREYQSYFNITALHLQSKEAGADRIPGDVEKDTACDAKVEWQRLTCNPEKVFSYIRRFPEAMARDHQGIVIVNDYADVATGGGGVATVSKAGLSVVNHEVGHAFGGLLDEYDYTPGTDPDRPIPKGRKGNVATGELRPNLMVGSDREDVLAHTYWQNWIDAGEERWWNNSKVSIFEGGNHTPFEVWRPQMGCMMRDQSGFCVVCMETMVKQIYRRVRPIDRLDPEPGEVTLEAGGDQIFQVWPMQPRTHDLEITWRLVALGVNKPRSPGDDSDPGGTSVAEGAGEVHRRAAARTDVDGRTIHGAELRAKDLRPGWYRLKVEVRDPTEWVLEDPDELLVERAEWLVEVKAKQGE